MNYLHTFGCISYVHVELDRRSKLDPKSKRCIFIGYRTSEYKDVIFNERKIYKDLLTERNTSKKNLRVVPRSTPEQSSAADSEFVELDDVHVEKIRRIPEENELSRVEPLTP